MGKRVCKIESGAVELENGAGDGAYDLLDAEGTPEEIGAAIAESLADMDLMEGRRGSCMERGIPLYLTLRIRVETAEEQEAKPQTAAPLYY